MMDRSGADIILMVNLKARDHYEDQSGDERIIEIWVFKK